MPDQTQARQKWIEQIRELLKHFRSLEHIDSTSYFPGVNAENNLNLIAEQIANLPLLVDTAKYQSAIDLETGKRFYMVPEEDLENHHWASIAHNGYP